MSFPAAFETLSSASDSGDISSIGTVATSADYFGAWSILRPFVFILSRTSDFSACDGYTIGRNTKLPRTLILRIQLLLRHFT